MPEETSEDPEDPELEEDEDEDEVESELDPGTTTVVLNTTGFDRSV
jgi:hypothetical protein